MAGNSGWAMPTATCLAGMERPAALAENPNPAPGIIWLAPTTAQPRRDTSVAWRQSRYDRNGSADYINCPLDHPRYLAFLEALLQAEQTQFKEWETST